MFNVDCLQNMNVCLIINPKAGHAVSVEKGEKISNMLKKHGCNVECFYTAHTNHATELVEKNLGKADVFVCCGGDGTLNETVAGIMHCAADTPIGYIPSGTTNDFANTLGLPKNPEKAVEMIANGNIFRTDVGIINGTHRHFTYIASFGAFANVSYETPQDVKNMLGHTAYILDGIKSIKDIKPIHARIKADDWETEGSFIYGSVTNSMSVGGMISLKKDDVVLDDGKFEVLTVSAPENVQQLGETMRMLFNRKYDGKRVNLTHSSHVEFEFDKPISFTADGEFAGEYEKISIDNIPRGLKIYTTRNHA